MSEKTEEEAWDELDKGLAKSYQDKRQKTRLLTLKILYALFTIYFVFLVIFTILTNAPWHIVIWFVITGFFALVVLRAYFFHGLLLPMDCYIKRKYGKSKDNSDDKKES